MCAQITSPSLSLDPNSDATCFVYKSYEVSKFHNGLSIKLALIARCVVETKNLKPSHL